VGEEEPGAVVEEELVGPDPALFVGRAPAALVLEGEDAVFPQPGEDGVPGVGAHRDRGNRGDDDAVFVPGGLALRVEGGGYTFQEVTGSVVNRGVAVE
jgi:hypothetical protein